MAVSGNADLTANQGFQDSRLGQTGYRTSSLLTEDDNYGSINDLDTRLSAINPTYWTLTRLQRYSKNDKVYALRLATADAAGLK